MLSRTEFWTLIGTLGGSIDETAAENLSRRLAAGQAGVIVAFADQLAAVLHALDSSERADQLVVDPTVGDDPISMSDDEFLYARCAVVVAGRATWDDVLADPSAMAGTWRVFDSEWLLAVAPVADELATGDSLDHKTPLSYETGSNLEAWGGPGTSAGPDSRPAETPDATAEELLDVAVQHRRGRGWMSLTNHAEVRLPWRPVYMRYQREYVNWINHDDAWTRWWVSHPYRDLVISAWLERYHDDDHHVAKKGRRDLTLDAYVDGQFLMSTDRRVHLHKARADLERLLALAVTEFTLEPTPPLPRDPAPPAGIDLDQPEPDDDSSPDSLWWEWMVSPWNPEEQRLGGRLGPF